MRLRGKLASQRHASSMGTIEASQLTNTVQQKLSKIRHNLLHKAWTDRANIVSIGRPRNKCSELPCSKNENSSYKYALRCFGTELGAIRNVFTATINNRTSVTIANTAMDSLEENVLRADDASYWLFYYYHLTNSTMKHSRVYDDSGRMEDVNDCLLLLSLSPFSS